MRSCARSEEIHQKLLDARVDAALYIEEGMWHVYPLYPVPGAARQGLISDF